MAPTKRPHRRQALFVTGERARQFGIQLRLLHEIHLPHAGLGIGESGVKAQCGRGIAAGGLVQAHDQIAGTVIGELDPVNTMTPVRRRARPAAPYQATPLLRGC